jgi:hypothetical protein
VRARPFASRVGHNTRRGMERARLKLGVADGAVGAAAEEVEAEAHALVHPPNPEQPARLRGRPRAPLSATCAPGLGLTAATSAPGLGLTRATSAPGLGTPRATSAPGLGTSAPGLRPTRSGARSDRPRAAVHGIRPQAHSVSHRVGGADESVTLAAEGELAGGQRGAATMECIPARRTSLAAPPHPGASATNGKARLAAHRLGIRVRL